MNYKMKFGDFVWPQNPDKLRIMSENSISSYLLPYRKSRSFIVAPKSKVFKGSGYFTGKSACVYAVKLTLLQKDPSPKTLTLPSGDTVLCVFSRFEMTFSADEQTAFYEFEFIEADTGDFAVASSKTTKVNKGENLFDVSKRTGVPATLLMRYNPAVFDPFDITLESLVISQ